jgi:hypothetical protein
VLVDGVACAVAVGVLESVGHAVVVAVGVTGVRPEALLSPAPEVVSVVVLFRIDDAVAVAVREQV